MLPLYRPHVPNEARCRIDDGMLSVEDPSVSHMFFMSSYAAVAGDCISIALTCPHAHCRINLVANTESKRSGVEPMDAAASRPETSSACSSSFRFFCCLPPMYIASRLDVN
eukprot:4920220-Pyramimonas_sp.AAC.1